MSTLPVVNGVPISVEMLWVYQIFSASLLAAFTFNMYDWFLTFADEWKYIWSVRHRNRRFHMWIQVLFVVLRYISLGSQLVLCAWNSRLMSIYPGSFLMCKKYRVFMLVSLLIQLNAIDFMMVLRAWLVFNRGGKCLFFLLLALICQFCIIFTVIFRFFMHIKSEMDGLCGPGTPLSLFALFWLAGFIVHTTSWAFTTYQCRRARKQGCGRTPLVQLLERDGTCFWLSFGVTVALGVTIGYRSSTAVASIIDPWAISLTSIFGCRMIINFQSLADKEDRNTKSCSGVMFTTNMPSYMSNMVWSKVDGQFVDAFIDAQNPLNLDSANKDE